MVMFSKCYRTALDEKINCGLPMTEENGVGSLTPPLAGYLDKVQERCASLDNCPWCASKSLTYALRSYRINFQDSLTLCTNPQCLFPLVSQHLEDVLANLVPVEPQIKNKRKTFSPLEREEVVALPVKRLRSVCDDGPILQTSASDPVSPWQPADTEGVTNGVDAAPETDGGKAHGCNLDVHGLLASPGSSFFAGGPKPSQDVVCFLDNAEAGLDTLPACLNTRPATCNAAPASATDQPCSTEDVEWSEVGVVQGCDVSIRQGNGPHQELPAPHNQQSKNAMYNPDSCEPANKDQVSPQLDERSSHTEQGPSTVVKSLISSLEVAVHSEPEDLDLPRMDDSSKDHSDSTPSQLEIISEDTVELVPVPPHLSWKNSANLCWLDVLLTVLVNCRTLRTSKPTEQPQHSPVWELIKRYDEACSVVRGQQLTGTDGVVRAPIHVLEKANSDLESLRLSIFKLLQPKLQCQLGQKETPVFAMPLLLKDDTWAESLFRLTFQWEHQCSNCKSATNIKVTKSLSTFTNIVPDWHPLHAAHLAPCNTCCQKNTTRTMVLERVAPIMALHFVEGLPDNDVSRYAFNFQGNHYAVTSVIQYDQRIKHFVCWIRMSDGAWQEFDDLKHPATHAELPVPAKDIHIVFWEAGKEARGGCPSPPPGHAVTAPSPDQSFMIPHDDTDIVGALSVSAEAHCAADASIGSTTLLDTFEGLTHSQIVTLTLVDVKVDPEGRLLGDSPIGVPIRCPAPDTFTATPPGHTPGTSDVSDADTADGSSSDPTYAPVARGTRARCKAKGAKRDKRARSVAAKAATRSSHSASARLCNQSTATPPAPSMPPAAEAQQGASAAFPGKTSPPSVSPGNPELPQPLNYSARWSYLISRNPLYQMHSTLAKAPPSQALAAQATPSPSHSTPKPVRRPCPPVSAGPKPQLRCEDGKALPAKPAEMYGAFNAKNGQMLTMAAAQRLPQMTVPADLPVSQPVLSGYQPPSLPPPAETPLPAVPSAKGQGGQSWKVPSDLGQTEALRHKLLKKLKAKKKRLEKLNTLLGSQGGARADATQKPDSTALNSPQTVSSSGLDASSYDEFFADLLSPATPVSRLSPDSTGFLEMIAYGQEAGDPSGMLASGGTSQLDIPANRDFSTNGVNVLEEFISGVAAQQQTEDLSLFF